jgi:hypothetical protein
MQHAGQEKSPHPQIVRSRMDPFLVSVEKRAREEVEVERLLAALERGRVKWSGNPVLLPVGAHEHQCLSRHLHRRCNEKQSACAGLCREVHAAYLEVGISVPKVQWS